MKLPYRILVLDDDEHALSGIVELLRDAGHHVTGAATYDAAKRLLAVSPFDLLVSDVRAAVVQRPPPRHADAGRPPRDGDHHHHRLRRSADRSRGAPLSRRSRPQADPSGGVPAARQRGAEPGAPPAPLAAQARRRRLPRDDQGTPGRRRGRVVRRAAARAARTTSPCPTASTSRWPASACTWRSSRCGRQSLRETPGTICGATLAAEHTPSARTWRAIVDRLNA